VWKTDSTSAQYKYKYQTEAFCFRESKDILASTSQKEIAGVAHSLGLGFGPANKRMFDARVASNTKP
jgi:hypothetical protein